MGKSKSDLQKQANSIKNKIAELEEKCKKDPLKRNFAIHDELAKLKKKLEG